MEVLLRPNALDDLELQANIFNFGSYKLVWYLLGWDTMNMTQSSYFRPITLGLPYKLPVKIKRARWVCNSGTNARVPE